MNPLKEWKVSKSCFVSPNLKLETNDCKISFLNFV